VALSNPVTGEQATVAAPRSGRAARRNGGGAPAGAGASPALDRVLPHSPEAEVAVLGAMLLSPDVAGSIVRDRLAEEAFYQPAHQVIYREIAALQDVLQPIDLVTLSQRLQDKRQLDEVGGPGYLSQLVTRVPTAANVEHYVQIVADKHLLRQLILTASEIAARSFEEQDDVASWVDEVEQQMFAVTAERATTSAQPVRALIKDAMASIEKLIDQKGALTGIPTGFRDLDKLTSGLHDGNVIVIAGRPSMGKTALAMNIAENVAIDQNIPVGVFSLEMSSEELVKRLLCSQARVNLRAVRDGFLSEEHFPRLTTAASRLMRAPLLIDDTAGLTVHQVRARARRLKAQHNIKLLVIDYLQLMKSPSRRADASRQVEIADISGGVKALAKELKIPIIVLSQLNRQPEARDEGKPRLSDLRESGAIEQDADLVGLLVRPEVYEDDEEKRSQLKGKATLIIAKQRNGPTGDVPLSFLHEFTRFEDASKIDDDDRPDRGEGGE
jgi:replicative DNA helicase